MSPSRTTARLLLLLAYELAISVLIFDALRLSIGIAVFVVILDLWDIYGRGGSAKYLLVTTPWPLLAVTAADAVSHSLEGWSVRGVAVLVSAAAVALVAALAIWVLQRGQGGPRATSSGLPIAERRER